MAPKTKKIITVSVAFLFTVLVAFYFLWPLMFVSYMTGIQKLPHLDVQPKIITKLSKHNDDTDLHDLGIIGADLKTADINNITVDGNNLVIIEYETHYLTITPWENVEDNPEIQFQRYYEIYTTTPHDVKLFNKRDANISALTNLILKSVSLTSGSLEIINTDNIKIISQMYSGQKGPQKMILTVYDDKNKFSQSFIISSKLDDNDSLLRYQKFIDSIIPSGSDGDFQEHMTTLATEIRVTMERDQHPKVHGKKQI